MKAAKKARQRKRRASTRAKSRRKAIASADKSFGAAVSVAERKLYPHMEWDGAAFSPTKPKPPPTLNVNVTTMLEAHKKCGVHWKGSRKGAFQSHSVEAYADTCCQTCTAGVDFINLIGCPESYLVPTSHRIIGITASSLNIIGSVLLRIEVGGKVTRQMVHISRNCHGLYLSETALMDLEVIPRTFPDPPATVAHTSTSTTTCCTDGSNGPCIERTQTPDRPSVIPYAPTADNVPALEKYLLDTFASSAFNMCTNQPLQGMTGVTMDIVFKPDAGQPRPVYTPIPVPFHWKRQVKADLDRDVRLGIIERVPQGDVTEWCSRMVVTPKTNGKPRRTVDLQQLNKNTLREVHHTPSPINLVSQIPRGKRKTVLDAWNGYHSLELSPKAKSATTFITEFGRYRYCRGPQGFHGTGDAYTRRFDDITSDEQRYVRCIDDGLLWDDDIEQSFWHAFDHIKMCADNGIVFNRDKFMFGREVVEFAGFEVTMDGYRPSPKLLSSIQNFPTPTNITDIRSWFGLVNNVAYTFSQSHIMAPFRDLLKRGQKFYWDDELETLFQKSKDEIIQQAKDGVLAYDLHKPTCLATDWSKIGIGFTLTQKHCKCPGPANPSCGQGHWKLVHAGSRFTQKGERELFSPTEGECLAAAFGLEKCRMFTLGCPNLILAVDHQPLKGVLNDRSLDSLDNPRLLKLKERTLPYAFQIIHVPGTSNVVKPADTLSRYPTDHEPADEREALSSRAFATQQAGAIESITWEKVKEAAGLDEECLSLVLQITDGFPDQKTSLAPILQKYWGMRDDLYVVDGVPFKGRKMLIPSQLRAQVLEGLHAANQGVTGMLSNARTRFFWPGMDAAVRQLRDHCGQCNEQAPSQAPEPLIFTQPAEVPFEQTVTDLCKLEGHTFLIYADRFSGWVEVERLPGGTFRHVKAPLLRWFGTYGVPEHISSDGGPPYNSLEFKKFTETWDITWRKSSAYFPQSNGRAEAAVKSAKRILLGNIDRITGALDTDKATRAILAHRNTPCQDTGIAPSVMLFGRPIRDHLPRHDLKLRPEWNAIAESRENALAKRVLIPDHNSRNELTPLNLGDSVQIQNQAGNHPGKWNSTGIISGVLPNRQYQVLTDGSRRVTLRNRRFLKKISPVSRKVYDDTLDITQPALAPVEKSSILPQPSPTPTPTPLSHDTINTSVPVIDSPEEAPPSEHIDTMLPSDRPNDGVRRSSRPRVPRKVFSVKLHGKTHE